MTGFGDQGPNPFTQGGNPYMGPGANVGRMGDSNPGAVPQTTKPRQMPMGGGIGQADQIGADMGGDTNVPQDGGKPAGAQVGPGKQARLSALTRDILATNPHLGVRKATLLAEEVIRRYPVTKEATQPNPQTQRNMGDLNDPNHPYWQQVGGHPFYQQSIGPGGRPLQANPNSNYPYIEDAANRAAQWGVNKARQMWQNRQQRQQQPTEQPAQQGQPVPVPKVAPPHQGPWGTPAPSPAPGSVQTPAPNGWKPAPLPKPAQPVQPVQKRRMFGPKGRHAASLVYGSPEV